MAECDKERYAWYKEHGICVRCGQEKADKGHTRCLQCRFIDIDNQISYKERHKETYAEYQKQYQRNLRAYRKEHGLCQQCGKPTNNGHVFCTEHLATRRVRQQNRQREKGVMPRELMGNGKFCYFCGKPVANKGDKCCPKCLKRERKWSAEMRKRIDYENHIWHKLNDAHFREHEAKTKEEK